MTPPPSQPWYKDGLSFKCTGCGKCCTGSPGVVWISEEEIHAVANFLQQPVETVTKNHVRKLGDRFALLEHKKSNSQFDCTFLKGKQCTIYPVRPKQCQTFPWWKENLESLDSWNEAAEACEGINHVEAPVISLEEIRKQLV